MIALLAVAVLQATSPGISFDEAVSLPANELAIRVLGEAGRSYVEVYRPREAQRSPPSSLRFFTRPDASSERLCTMRSTTVYTTASVPGQEALDQEPEGWRRYRKLVYGPPLSQELFRPSGLQVVGEFAKARAVCGRLEPKSGSGWFSADDSGAAGLAVQFAQRLLPSERNGAPSTEPAVDEAARPLLAQMRLDRLGMVKSSPCNLLAAEPGSCQVLYFSHPDDDAHLLSLIVSYDHRGRYGPSILTVRAVDDFVFVP